jgi:hypothetical protein
MCLLSVSFFLTAILLRDGGGSGHGETQKDGAAGTVTRARNSIIHRDVERIKSYRPIRTITSAPIPEEDPKSEDGALADELIIKLKPGVTNVDQLALSLRAQVAGRMEKFNAYRLQFADAADASAAREQLAANPEVESVDSNYAISLPPSGDAVSSSAATAKLAIKPGDAGGKLIIGLIDTAVQIQSSGMDESFFLPPISVAGETSANLSAIAHGTSMAEAILQGLSAVEAGKIDTSVRILPVDVYGGSETTTSYQVGEGIVKAIEKGATIINLSLGSSGDSSLLRQVIEEAHAQGIIFFGAAGNQPVTTPTYPAAYSQVVAVTAVDGQGNVAPYANYGDFVDVAVPGTVIVTYDGNPYLITGTSASAALVSGAAGGLTEKTRSSAAKIEEAVRKALALR